jgi:predicted phosphodiesterase
MTTMTKAKMGGAERVRLKREQNLPDTLRELALTKRQLSHANMLVADLMDEHEAEIRAGSLRFTPTIIKPQDHVSGAPGYPMTIWSDWHWGEVVRKDETGGANAFNRRIAFQRVENLVNNTIGLLRDYAGKNPEYPGIWVMLGGDMISGSIHEELRETNWGTVEEQAIEVGDVLAGALLRMADEFGTVHVPCVVGNHGRKAHRPPAKAKVRENREYGVYKSLARQFSSDPRFHFYVPEETDFYFSVYGHRFLLTHGDSLGVKGGDGIIGALGPIARGTIKVSASERQIGRDLDTLVMGHWHTYIPRSEAVAAIVNGTLKGYDEYARLFLRVRFARPSQALWLVSPKHGIAAQWAVYI